MREWIIDSRVIFFLSLILAGILVCPGWTKHGIALAGQNTEASSPLVAGEGAASGNAAEYHTPLAGEPLNTIFMDNSIDLPAKDRSRVTALTLGGAFYFPKQGETSATPIGSLYLKRVWQESRTRNQISIFVNDLEYDKSFGNLELITRMENNTISFGQREVVNNREIKSSDTIWGTVIGSIGPGLRYKVAPFQVDIDLRLQLLGKVGYFYAERTNDTGTMFNQVLVSKYALLALEYRRELAFFIYLHLRETFIWADRAAVTDTNKFMFKSTLGAATTTAWIPGFSGIPRCTWDIRGTQVLYAMASREAD